MKLRLRENSIRLRLLRGEVAQLGAIGIVKEKIRFGESELAYILQASANTDCLSASFAGDKIIVTLPVTLARQWVESEDVGIEAEQAISPGETLKILIEKDFVCLDRADDADNKDAYPHPNINCWV